MAPSIARQAWLFCCNTVCSERVLSPILVLLVHGLLVADVTYHRQELWQEISLWYCSVRLLVVATIALYIGTSCTNPGFVESSESQSGTSSCTCCFLLCCGLCMRKGGSMGKVSHLSTDSTGGEPSTNLAPDEPLDSLDPESGVQMTVIDEGIQKRRGTMEIDADEEGVELRWCKRCQLQQPLRSKHCHDCGRCVRTPPPGPSSEDMNMKWICQTAAALAHLHSDGVVHRDLKADNVLLTATEDVKLADFGLAREYTALKGIDVKQDDGSWLRSYTQYYMDSGVGPIHWVAPEFFTGRYTEKADVFSLGTLFFAILERDFIVIGGTAIYGAFVNIPGVGKVGLGYAMAKFGRSISVEFASGAQESIKLKSVVLEALQYDKNDRPSAQDMYRKVLNIKDKRSNNSSGSDNSFR